jgi:hypothetical protein
MDPQQIEDDEKRVRAAIREFENAKFNIENGAPVFRPEFAEYVNEIEKYL